MPSPNNRTARVGTYCTHAGRWDVPPGYRYRPLEVFTIPLLGQAISSLVFSALMPCPAPPATITSLPASIVIFAVENAMDQTCASETADWVAINRSKYVSFGSCACFVFPRSSAFLYSISGRQSINQSRWIPAFPSKMDCHQVLVKCCRSRAALPYCPSGDHMATRDYTHACMHVNTHTC